MDRAFAIAYAALCASIGYALLHSLRVIIATLAVTGCVASGNMPRLCPDGSEPTTWCGCMPPIYGTDC